MIIYLLMLLSLLAFFTAFMSAIISGITLEDIMLISESDPKRGERLQKLKNMNDTGTNPFLIIEILFYTFAAIITGAFVVTFTGGWSYLVWAGLILFFCTLIVRTTFYFLGSYFAFFLARKLYPVISFLSIISRPFTRIFLYFHNRFYGHEGNEAKREEINALLESSHEEGSIDSGEYRILKNMMKFGEVLVSDVMTPRTVMFTCEADMTVGEVINTPEMQMYSRIPVWEGDSLDNGVIGYVLSKDLLHMALKGHADLKLRDLVRQVYFIPENAELDNALDLFLQKRQHIFVVVDEYGGVEGLLTMEDVLETMLGVEIVDEADRVIDLRLFAKQRRDKRIASIIQKSESPD